MAAVTQEMIALYDDFTHGRMARADFEAAMAAKAGSADAAAEAERAIAADASAPPQVAADDARLSCARTDIPGGQTGLSGYACRPAGATGPLPAVLVVHENRGLNPHIEDVTRRVALGGFLALGLDFLSPHGGTPEDEDRARDMIGELDPAAVDRDGLAALAWLRARGTGRTGVVGFCWGGAVSGRMATLDPALDAAVVYYGRPPASEKVPAVKAALLLHYAGLDEKINAQIPPFEEALRAAGVAYDRHDYPGANHAFNNDASAARHDPAASALAWGRTVGFLRHALGGA